MRDLAMVICIAFVVIVMTSCVAYKGSFLLINRAKEPIARALVTICEQTIELKDIQPTKSASGSYDVKSDSHYDVMVEFRSGIKLQKRDGYVTNGFDFKDEITVTDIDINVTKSVTTYKGWIPYFLGIRNKY